MEFQLLSTLIQNITGSFTDRVSLLNVLWIIVDNLYEDEELNHFDTILNIEYDKIIKEIWEQDFEDPHHYISYVRTLSETLIDFCLFYEDYNDLSQLFRGEMELIESDLINLLINDVDEAEEALDELRCGGYDRHYDSLKSNLKFINDRFR